MTPAVRCPQCGRVACGCTAPPGSIPSNLGPANSLPLGERRGPGKSAATKPELGECPLTASHTRRACDNGGSCWCIEHPEEVAQINAHPEVIEARSAASTDDEQIVHPHKCPRCLSTDLIRVSEFTGRFEQPLDRIINFYGGSIGLRAAVAADAPKTDTQYGVKTALLRCGGCGYESDNLLHFAEVQSGS